MLDQTVAKLLNEQINKEFYSAYIYLDIANYYLSENLNGFGNWFKVQAQEEKDHANLFITYLLDNGVKVELGQIDSPGKDYKGFKDPLEESLRHEQFVTASINKIYEAAFNVKDFRTMQFLDWFIKEQGEEEKNAEELIKKYELFAGDGKGLYMLDTELASRAYAPPTLTL
jgi:ferritin